MKTSFALTTRQAAKLAGVESHVLYSHVSRFGHWQSVTPRKLPNGRLLWRADEVHRALDLIPYEADMTPGERAWVAFLYVEGFPLTSEVFKVGRRFLSHEADHGRDPSYYADESALFVELASAFCDRLDDVLPVMNERDRKRTRAALAMVASTAGSFADESEAKHG